METFTLISKLGLFNKKTNKKGGAKQSQQKKGGRSQATQGRSQATQGSSQATQDDDDEEDNEDGGDDFNQEEVEISLIGLEEVLHSLHKMLDHCSLKRSTESIESAVTELVKLTGLETSSNLDLRSTARRKKAGDVSNLALLAYQSLEKLCTPLHGENGGGVLLVLQGLLPSILMVSQGKDGVETTGKRNAISGLRANGLQFVRHLVNGGDPSVRDAVLVLVQHMAVKVPDKSEFRKEAADAIMELMKFFSTEMFNRTVNWFIRYAHSEKSSNRLFSVEVIGKLIYCEDREDDPVEENNDKTKTQEENEKTRTEDDAGNDAGSSSESSNDKESGETENNTESNEQNVPKKSPPKPSSSKCSRSFLFACIYGRCSDVSPTVRTTALKVLGDITADNSEAVQQGLDIIFNPRKKDCGQDFVLADLLEDEDLDQSSEDLLPSGKEFVEFLRRRALDQSVFVRKSALQVLENIIRSSEERLTSDLVTVLADHCRDPSLAVRKQMVISLTELLKTYPDKDELVEVWVSGIFPLILDVEAKASEKVLECIWDLLFTQMVPSRRSGYENQLPWRILTAVQKTMMTNYLSRACNTWAKEGKLNNTVMSTLQSFVGSDHNGSAWMLLGLISAHVPCKDPGSVLEYLRNSITTPEGVGMYTLLQVLKVLYASVSKLSDADRSQLQGQLLTMLSNFVTPPELISASMDVVTVVSSLEYPAEKNPKQYQSAIDGWAVPILESIDKELSAVFLQSPTESVDEELLMRQVFTLGEVSQICPHRINNRIYLLMQSIVFRQNEPDVNDQECELPSTPTQSSQAPMCTFKPSSKLQALTIVSLGKLCLQNEFQAKRIIPAFGQILETSSDPAIKNNIMYALRDMCVRYASLVDPLLPQMTACLKDPITAVRRTTLIILVNLLQEDYLKIRGNGKFFFRIIQTNQDESDEIRNLTTFYIQQRLLKRIPKIMYVHFVESLFNFNNYTSHASYNKFPVTDKERKLFDLSGSRNENARREIYCFMLSHMDDEGRFQTTYRLCQDVLGGVVEGTVTLGPTSMDLLKDAFFCLASDKIKLQSLKSKSGAEDEVEQDMADKVLEATKKAVISSVVKKNVIENIIPIIIALKRKLEEIKSPLICDLFIYLRKLMEDYKTEVTDILAADKQLAKEIEFELKRFDQEQEEKQERQRQEQERRRSGHVSRSGTPSRGSGTPSRGKQSRAGTPSRGKQSRAGTPSRERRRSGQVSEAATPSRREGRESRTDLIKQAFQKALVQTSKKGDKRLSTANMSGLDSVFENENNSNKSTTEKNVQVEGSVNQASGEKNKSTTSKEMDAPAEAGNVVLDQADKVDANSSNVVEPNEITAANVEPNTNINNIEENITTDKASDEANKINTDPKTATDGAASTDVEKEKPEEKGDKTEVLTSNNEDGVGGVVSNDVEKEKPEEKGDQTDEVFTSDKEDGSKTSTDRSTKSKEVEKEKCLEEDDLESREKSFESDVGAGNKKSEEGDKEIVQDKPVGKEGTSKDNPKEKGDEETEKDVNSSRRSDMDVDKSKRVSGQGMERPKLPKTPTRSRAVSHNRRAISTPQVNKTVLASNVTFLGESVMELSCITVLSPPSSVADPDSRRSSVVTKSDDSDGVTSFKFKKKGKDLFEELCAGDEASKKRKQPEERKDDKKRRTRSSIGSSRSNKGSLGSIEEEINGSKKK